MRKLLLLTILVVGCLFAQPQLPPAAVQLSNTVMHVLPAKAVADTFQIVVALPSSYASSSSSFPVVYLLDSDKSFGMARDIVNWLSWSRELPQVIVVGISYGGTNKQWWDKRTRDYLPTRDTSGIWGSKWPYAGGGEAFRTFLKSELFPFIEKTYRTIPNDRTIVGISFGGVFASYVLFTDPSMFSRYIISGPALIWDNKRAFTYESKFFSHQKSISATVFTSIGLEDTDDIIQPWREFNKVIASRKYENLRWIVLEFPDETHISVFPAALARGLKTVFAK
jgi:predicted alpha/beta superfamily hydrolase